MNMRRYVPAVAFALSASSAFAHAQLQKAIPAVGSTVGGTSQVKLYFSEGVEPKFSAIAVTDASGSPVKTGKPAVAADDAEVLFVNFAAPLQPGVYTVTWKAVSVDTHRTQGSFNFTVKP